MSVLAVRKADPVSDSEARSNDIPTRVRVLERQVDALIAGKPDVVADRVQAMSGRVNDLRAEMKEELTDMRDEVRSLKRVFISVFSGVGVAIAAAIVALIITGGNP